MVLVSDKQDTLAVGFFAGKLNTSGIVMTADQTANVKWYHNGPEVNSSSSIPIAALIAHPSLEYTVPPVPAPVLPPPPPPPPVPAPAPAPIKIKRVKLPPLKPKQPIEYVVYRREDNDFIKWFMAHWYLRHRVQVDKSSISSNIVVS